MKKTLTSKLPMKLQFFAEPEPSPEPQPEPSPEPTLSIEEQLAQIQVELAREKKARDKACSEAADFKRKYNSTLDEKQQAALEKAETEAVKDELLNQLKKENTVTKLEKSFLALGYTEEIASKAANAQYDGDTDTLFKIQQGFQAALLKQKEAEWLKNRPTPQGGVGEEEATVSKEKFDKMGYSQRVEFQNKYPKTYKTYTQ